MHCQGIRYTAWRPVGFRFFYMPGMDQCAAKGSDLGPGIPCGVVLMSLWRPLGLRQDSDERLGVPWGSVAFAWWTYDNVHCQIFLYGRCGEMPRERMYALALLGAPLLLRSRRKIMCTAKDFMYVLASCGFRRFYVTGMEQCGLPRGQMYILAPLETPPLSRGRRGILCITKESHIYPGFPWDFVTFAW